MKSIFFLGLLAAMSCAQVTRDNDGYSTTDSSADWTPSPTDDAAPASRTAQQYPAYNAPSSTDSISIHNTWVTDGTESASATWTDSAPSNSAASSDWNSASAVVPTANPSPSDSAAWSATPASTGASSAESTFTFGDSTATMTTKTSATKTAASGASTSAFTGAANVREIAFGFGAAAAGLAIMF